MKLRSSYCTLACGRCTVKPATEGPFVLCWSTYACLPQRVAVTEQTKRVRRPRLPHWQSCLAFAVVFFIHTTKRILGLQRLSAATAGQALPRFRLLHELESLTWNRNLKDERRFFEMTWSDGKKQIFTYKNSKDVTTKFLYNNYYV